VELAKLRGMYVRQVCRLEDEEKQALAGGGGGGGDQTRRAPGAGLEEEVAPFVRYSAEVLLPSIELPRLDSGPAVIRGISMVLGTGRVALSNCPRCSKSLGLTTIRPPLQPFTQGILAQRASAGVFPWACGVPLLPTPVDLVPVAGDYPDVPDLHVVKVDQLWLDAYRMEAKTPIVRPVGITLWSMETRLAPVGHPPASKSHSRSASLSDAKPPSPRPPPPLPSPAPPGINHNLVTVDGPVAVTLTRAQLLFLQQMLDDYKRSDFLLDSGEAVQNLSVNVISAPHIEARLVVEPRGAAGPDGGHSPHTPRPIAAVRPIADVRLMDLQVAACTHGRLADSAAAARTLDVVFPPPTDGGQEEADWRPPARGDGVGHGTGVGDAPVFPEPCAEGLPPQLLFHSRQELPDPELSKAFFRAWDAREYVPQSLRRLIAADEPPCPFLRTPPLLLPARCPTRSTCHHKQSHSCTRTRISSLLPSPPQLPFLLLLCQAPV